MQSKTDRPLTQAARARMKKSSCGKEQRQAQATMLREHYATEAADSGLRSSWGPMVDMASQGIPCASGRASYEGSITDRRHGFFRTDDGGRPASGRAAEHLRVHSALKRIKPRGGLSAARIRDVLYAAYRPDPRPWHPQVRQPLAEHLGDELAVAMLTPRVQEGIAMGEVGELAAPRKPKAGDRPSAVRVWEPSASALDDPTTLDLVVSQALDMLRLTHEALMQALGGPSPAAKPPRSRTYIYREGIRVEESR